MRRILETGIFPIFIILITTHQTNGTCSWPTVFDTSTWWDSQQGTLQFTSSTGLTGFELTFYSSTINTFICQEETFTTDGTILIRSATAVSGIGGNWYFYVCLRLTQIVDGVSYRYYMLSAQEKDAGEKRIKAELGATSDSKTIADVCDATDGASGAEFGTIIKQGSESSAYITCPTILHGRFEFNYTDSGGTESCNAAPNQEHMNVCTDKSKLAFDVPCTGQSIVYASDFVYCVASVSSGSDTYIQLYNPDPSPDDSTTYKFSCMALSSDSRSATIVYNNCTNHQTSTYVPRDHDSTTVIGASISFIPYVFCQGGCTWPSPFVNSVWRDNTRGDITFGSDTLSGWTISMPGSDISEWECLDISDFDTTTLEGLLIIKSTQTFSSLGGTWTSFICFEMTKVTDNSYYYYQKHEQGDTERGYFNTDGTITGKDNICATSYTVPFAEFHFMVKSGSESASKQYCPPSLLATMDYTHTDDAGTTTCSGTTDSWDVCTDRTTMTFNYTSPPLCDTTMIYSTSGVLYCMLNFTSTNEYVVVYNSDASPTYRFACIVSNPAGTAASVVYNNCTTHQTPTTYAKLHDGSDIGALLTMTAIETCPFLGPTVAPSTDGDGGGGGSGGSIIPMVVGAVVGLLAILIIAAIVIYCIKKKKKGEVTPDDEKKKLPDDNGNGHIHNIKVEDMDSNPALTVHPERNTLTPLPPKYDSNATSPRVLPPISNHV